MKKLLLFGLTPVICCLFLINQHQLTSVSAQKTVDEKSGKFNGTTARKGDKELAESIKKLTNRSAEGLKIETNGDGFTVDLEGRFQNVMLSKIDFDGEPAAACVTSLDEANSFFERNLETGEYVPSYQYQKDYASNPAARHGMSDREFEFYKKLIEDAARRKTGPYAGQVVEAACEQPRAGQQRQGQGHLRHHERRAHVVGASRFARAVP